MPERPASSAPAQAPVDADSATLVADVVSGSVPSRAASSRSGERTRLAGRYEILALIGAGGMGTVYRALDTVLDEVVALKVMRDELLGTPGILERFRREAKLARRVTHRNVARVFDIGEHEQENFLTMELVEGESLSAALAREGAMSIRRACEIAIGIAEGLHVAHEAGVVHRDLKPDNVLLGKDGRVVVTDFGIARAVVDVIPQTGERSDTLGMFVGTPAYMAPEQVKGSALIGARADIYAFGAVLFELLTGHRAWPGDAPLTVATARLLEPPRDPRTLRPDLAAPLAELVLRCLARDPNDRPHSMREVAAALASVDPPTTHRTPVPASGPAPHTIASPTPPPHSQVEVVGASYGPKPASEKTVAVLPFRNTGAPEDEYVAEELTDDLIDALSMTRGLRVRARGAVLRYRGAEADAREIGRELGVQVVVEGSVRRARGQVRISARLVSVADGFQVWAKRFDRPEQEVLSINDEAARAIAEALTLDGHSVAERAAPSHPIAIDLYLRARHTFRQWGVENQRRAVELFDEALAIAPDDPLLLSGIAMALARLCFFDGPKSIPRAREAAERAVRAAPHLGEAHLALGNVLFQINDAAGAARALRAAVTHGPGLADAHASLGRLLGEVGAVPEAIRHVETALSLAPDTVSALMDLARLHALYGRWDEAVALYERLEKSDPSAYWTIRSRTVLWRGDAAQIARDLERLPDTETMRFAHVLKHVAATRQMPEALFDIEKEELTGGPRRRAFVLQVSTEVLAYCGHDEEALAALEHSVRLGLIDRTWIDRCPLLDALRQSPRFAPLQDELRRRSEAILEAYRG